MTHKAFNSMIGAWVVSRTPSWLQRRGGDALAEREEHSLGQAKPLPPPPARRHLAAATSSRPSQRFDISNSNFKQIFIYKRI